MLIVSGTSRRKNQQRLTREFARDVVPVRVVIDRSSLVVESEPWRTYWKPCQRFFGADRRLVRRLDQLRKTWLALLRKPTCRRRRRDYCWRYFCLLHHTLRIACEEPERDDPIGALRQVLGFETFTIEVRGKEGVAAGLVSSRNPVFVLGRLPVDAPLPSPRHAPLVMPTDAPSPFYCYRQLRLDVEPETAVIVCSSVELKDRISSFGPIDRLARLLSAQGDPRWKPRARLLAHRVLTPLLQAEMGPKRSRSCRAPTSLLDLGAGTGHLAAVAWREVCSSFADGRRPMAALHYVDVSGPCAGRSFGLARESEIFTHVEWTRADYRKLLDDDDWLGSNGPFNWVFICRLLGNASNIIIEKAAISESMSDVDSDRCNPCKCLAPGQQPDGLKSLRVRTVRRSDEGGTFMPQFSLSDYFAAMRAAMSNSLDATDAGASYLPVRRFNPAALTTVTGRSVIAQLMKVASAIVIEDTDLQPEHLTDHRRQFDLDGTAAINFVGDGFNTEVHHYVVTGPRLADRLAGNRLW